LATTTWHASLISPVVHEKFHSIQPLHQTWVRRSVAKSSICSSALNQKWQPKGKCKSYDILSHTHTLSLPLSLSPSLSPSLPPSAAMSYCLTVTLPPPPPTHTLPLSVLLPRRLISHCHIAHCLPPHHLLRPVIDQQILKQEVASAAKDAF
jgi:hypothetical protein